MKQMRPETIILPLMVSGGRTQQRRRGVILENKSVLGPQGEANMVHVVGFWWDNQPEKKKKTLDFSRTDVFVVLKSSVSQNYGWVLERNTANALLRLIIAN